MNSVNTVEKDNTYEGWYIIPGGGLAVPAGRRAFRIPMKSASMRSRRLRRPPPPPPPPRSSLRSSPLKERHQTLEILSYQTCMNQICMNAVHKHKAKPKLISEQNYI